MIFIFIFLFVLFSSKSCRSSSISINKKVLYNWIYLVNNALLNINFLDSSLFSICTNNHFSQYFFLLHNLLLYILLLYYYTKNLLYHCCIFYWKKMYIIRFLLVAVSEFTLSLLIQCGVISRVLAYHIMNMSWVWFLQWTKIISGFYSATLSSQDDFTPVSSVLAKK